MGPTELCRQAVEGEECYEAVMWAMDYGITSNPEWYPNLTASSPFEDFQGHFHNINHGNCPQPCPSCQLQVMYYVKNCTRSSRCSFAGHVLETGRCLEPASWRAGHYVRVNLQSGSETCADSATAELQYFANNSDCNGAPDSSMLIPTNGTK